MKTTAPHRADKTLLAAVLIVCCTLLAYWPALEGGLLWDDAAHVTRPELRSLHGLWRIWSDLGATQQYYPLLHSVFWIEHGLWGDAMLGYHLANLVLHAAAALVVMLIMRRLGLPGAWLAALIFVLHPVSVESVAWITEQKNTLSTVLCLSAALLYLDFDQTRRRSQYLLALALFVLALLSKTVTATLPAVLLVVFWWRRGRLGWKRDVLPLLPWFALGATAGLFTAWMERNYLGAEGPDFALTLVERFLLAGRVVWFYAGKLVWPANLMFVYPRWRMDAGEWWQYLFPLGALVALMGLGLLARKRRGPLAGALIFGGTLFPVLGFFNVYPFIYSYVADHFQYTASLGIIVPVASGLASAVSARTRPWAVAAACAGLAALGTLTWQQCGMYRDFETLFRETLKRNPTCWMAHNNLGLLVSQTPGGMEEAIQHYREALRLKPDYALAHHNLGLALSQMPDRLPEAIEEYRAALRLNPDSAEAHTDLGAALSKVPGRLPEAIEEYRAALRLNPDSATAHNDLGLALSKIPGRLPEAIGEYRAALRLDPYYALAHNNLGIALVVTPGRLSEAIPHLQAALRLKPDSAEIHNNLGSALSLEPGRLQEAIEEYRTALRLQPDYPDAQYNLGLALSKVPEATRQ